MTLIKSHLDIEAVTTAVIADGERIAERCGNWFTRSFAAGYPDLDIVIEQVKKHRASKATR